MEIKIESIGKYKIIKFLENDYISINTIGEFTSILNKLIDDGSNFIVLDFEKIIHIDSSGIGGLIEITRNIKTAKGKIYWVNISQEITEILEITQLTEFFQIFKSEEEMKKEILKD